MERSRFERRVVAREAGSRAVRNRMEGRHIVEVVQVLELQKVQFVWDAVVVVLVVCTVRGA